MVNDKNYSARLICSKKVKNYINNECRQKFIERNPELEGSNITENHILTDMIKRDLGLFYLENDKHNNNH